MDKYVVLVVSPSMITKRIIECLKSYSDLSGRNFEFKWVNSEKASKISGKTYYTYEDLDWLLTKLNSEIKLSECHICVLLHIYLDRESLDSTFKEYYPRVYACKIVLKELEGCVPVYMWSPSVLSPSNWESMFGIDMSEIAVDTNSMLGKGINEKIENMFQHFEGWK